MKEIKTAKCILEDNGRKYEITAELHYYPESGRSELYFRHVLTNQLCNFAEQVLHGWSEQNQIDNDNWRYLVKQIEQDMDLDRKIYEDEEIIEYYNKED